MLPLHYNVLSSGFNKQTRMEKTQALRGIRLLRLTPNTSAKRWPSLKWKQFSKFLVQTTANLKSTHPSISKSKKQLELLSKGLEIKSPNDYKNYCRKA